MGRAIHLHCHITVTGMVGFRIVGQKKRCCSDLLLKAIMEEETT